MQVVAPMAAGEKPSKPGWYVAFLPETRQTEIVRVEESYTVASEQILSVTLSGSGNHHPSLTTKITLIARIYPELIQAEVWGKRDPSSL